MLLAGNTTLSTETYFPNNDNSYAISDRHLDFFGGETPSDQIDIPSVWL